MMMILSSAGQNWKITYLSLKMRIDVEEKRSNVLLLLRMPFCRTSLVLVVP